jgi:hypothetical protein
MESHMKIFELRVERRDDGQYEATIMGRDWSQLFYAVTRNIYTLQSAVNSFVSDLMIGGDFNPTVRAEEPDPGFEATTANAPSARDFGEIPM